MGVDAEYRRVGRVDEPGVFPLLRDATGDVLPDAHDTDDLPLAIAPGRGIEEYLDARPLLGHEGEFVIGGLVPAQCAIDDHAHARLIILGNELTHEVLPHDLLRRVPDYAHRALVPDVDASL